MSSRSKHIAIKGHFIRCCSVMAVCLALSACYSNPSVVRNLPPIAGTDLYVRAPAKQVVERLPEAIRLAGVEMKEVDKTGPPTWQAIGLVGESWGTNGQWLRIIVDDVAPDLSHVSIVARPRGYGLFASYDTPPRNVLLTTLLVNSPAVPQAALEPYERPDLRLDINRFQNLARGAMAPLATPLWSQDNFGSNAAFLAVIEGRGLLVAHTIIKSIGTHASACATRVGKIALHEFGTGKAIWVRSYDSPGPVSLVASGTALVLQGANRLFALDAATGKELWTVPYHAATSALDGEAKYIVLWNRKQRDKNDKTGEKGYRESLMAVGLADGAVRWNADLAEGADADRRELFIEGNRVYAINSASAAYSLETGKSEAQEFPASTAFTPPVRHLALKDRMIIGDRAGKLIYVRSDGSVLWRKDLAGSIDHLSSDNGDLLVASSAESMLTLRLLSVNTGELLWERRDELLAGNVVFAGQSLVYSTGERVVLLDRGSGKETAATPRGNAMRRSRLPDRLLVYKNQVTVAGETGIMAVATGGKQRPGDLLWRLDLRGVDLSNLAARQDQARRATYNYGVSPATTADGLQQGAEDLAANAKLQAQLRQSFYVPMADFQATMNRQLIARLSQPGGSTLSTGQRMQLMQANMAAARAEAQMQLSLSVLDFSLGMASSYMANLQKQGDALLRSQKMRSQESISRAVELWALSLQGDLFVRPIGWEFGSGVLSVDLLSGRWAEVITGPGEPALQDFHIQYPPAILDRDARHLYTITQNGNLTTAEFPGFIVKSRTTAAFELLGRAKWLLPQEYSRKSMAPQSVLEVAIEQ